MSELLPVFESLIADADAGQPAVLCVVVKTRGSTPQTPGAAMLVRSDFSTRGTLGGGCVEAEVRRRAFELLRENQSGVLKFSLDHDYGWDDGLICGGQMFVAILPITAQTVLDPFRQTLDRARRREPASLPLTLDHEGKRVQYRLHFEVPPTLLIAGAGHVGQALARLAAGLDFHVIVIDDRAEYARPDRFPPGVELVVDDIAGALQRYPLDGSCYVVIVTRGHRHDQQALDAVVRRPSAYVGLIGSRRKVLLIRRDLAAAGVPEEQLERVHSPIGLAIGSVTVSEIAVSIAAELIQVRRKTTPVLVEGPIELPTDTVARNSPPS